MTTTAASCPPAGSQFFGPSDTPVRFFGEIAPAISTGSFEGEQIGFAFESTAASTSPRGWAQIGRHRNGSYL